MGTEYEYTETEKPHEEQSTSPQQENSQGKFGKFKRFITECKLVLRVTKKPDKEELKSIVKVTGLGIIALGFIGFLLQMMKQLLL